MKRSVIISLVVLVLVVAGFGGYKLYVNTVHNNKIAAIKMWDAESKAIVGPLNADIQSNKLKDDILAGDATSISDYIQKLKKMESDINAAPGFQYTDMTPLKNQAIKSANAKISYLQDLKVTANIIKTNGLLGVAALGNDFTNKVNVDRNTMFSESQKADKLYQQKIAELS